MRILAKNLVILASAGSGKTYQLGNRVIGLVAGGAEPPQIVALTFTRKAAGEFADAVLTKLATAAVDESSAAQLRDAIGLPDADFRKALEKVVRALPRLTFGTMDGFFAKIVRGFQYELGLTGGSFQLIEGPRAAAVADELLAAVLGDALAREQGDEFFHAFRRASIGKEDQGVLHALRGYVTRWQDRLHEAAGLAWGPAELAPEATPEVWAANKSRLAAAVMAGLDGIAYTHKSQRDNLEQCIALLESHAIGSGSLGSGSVPKLLTGILSAVAATTDGPLELKSYKEFTVPGPCARNLREMVELAARCELGAALQRTRAVRDVVGAFDALCERRLRSRGLLGFHDVKVLMGAWARDEESRLRREAVDFRLDTRIHHWLLDEFQDTSRADWTGLFPLIDEAATSPDGTVFVVGDKKQAIYAWRGGDVRLFDEVLDRYAGGDLTVEPMAESRRSCPEVLELVNQVCGDLTTLGGLFGAAAGRWVWDPHGAAEPLARPENRGEARVEVVGDWPQRLERLAAILRELGVGERRMTCGVLLRGNEKVRQTADFLRTHGFDVIEEGRREPTKDNPQGIAVCHLLKWLADPADRFSREVVAMSPFGRHLLDAAGGQWSAVWNALTARIAEHGFAATIEDIMEPLWAAWSDFGKRRAGDLLDALAEFDRQAISSCREAADWLDRLEVAQNPGSAAVQVMTIHKSKGLGFDVVVLPEIPDDPVPLSQYFDVAEGPGWITETPPKWARNVLPAMREAEERWAQDQRYEAFCTLYVALTRAKRGLYVLLAPPAETADPDKPSLANWLRRSLAAPAGPGIAFHAGSPDWVSPIPPLPQADSVQPPAVPGPAVPRRAAQLPSRAQAAATGKAGTAAGMAFGNQVHSLLEQVAWIDETPPPSLPETPAGQAVAALLRTPGLAPLFRRDQRSIDLLREQPVVAVQDGRLASGVIDRLHLHRGADSGVGLVHLIDFKTDAVDDPAELAAHHAAQMGIYQDALRRIYPGAAMRASLVSVRHGCAVEL